MTSPLYLVVEEGLGLLGVPEEQLVGVRLGQQVLPVLPHLVQLVPAGVERLQPLPQEHVLRVRLALRHHLAHVAHLLVVLLVVADLVLDVLVLGQQLLGLGQRVGHVLRGDGSLRPRQPRLEVVQVAQELLQLAGLAQGLLAVLHGVLETERDGQIFREVSMEMGFFSSFPSSPNLHLAPDAGDAVQTALDGLGLLRVFRGQAVGLFAQVAQRVLDGGEVALHPRQLPLQRHDAGQVVPELLGGLDHLAGGRESFIMRNLLLFFLSAATRF